jgi:hypothetical protein
MKPEVKQQFRNRGLIINDISKDKGVYFTEEKNPLCDKPIIEYEISKLQKATLTKVFTGFGDSLEILKNL